MDMNAHLGLILFAIVSSVLTARAWMASIEFCRPRRGARISEPARSRDR
jgi:hypothetical protein